MSLWLGARGRNGRLKNQCTGRGVPLSSSSGLTVVSAHARMAGHRKLTTRRTSSSASRTRTGCYRRPLQETHPLPNASHRGTTMSPVAGGPPQLGASVPKVQCTRHTRLRTTLDPVWRLPGNACSPSLRVFYLSPPGPHQLEGLDAEEDHPDLRKGEET